MSQRIYTNFDYRGTLPNFKRDSYKTLEAMAAVSDTVMPAMLLGYCEETGQVYLYNKENDVDEATGKWRLLQSGGGGSGAVDSVNGKTGAVILRATDIKMSDKTTTIQTKIDTIVNNTSVSAEEGNTLEQKSDGLYVPETVGGVSSVNTKTGAVILTGEDVNTSSDESSKTIKEDIESKQNKITSTNKLDYSLLDNTPTITTVVANPAEEAIKVLSKLTVGDTVYSVSGGEGAVTSVNEKTGDVVLSASDIKDSNNNTIQEDIDNITVVTANPRIAASESLTSLTVGETTYSIDGKVTSVNGLDGDVVLGASDIKYDSTATVKTQIDNVEAKTEISSDENNALIRDTNNKLSVPLSAVEGNTIIKKDDGIYVPSSSTGVSDYEQLTSRPVYKNADNETSYAVDYDSDIESYSYKSIITGEYDDANVLFKIAFGNLIKIHTSYKDEDIDFNLSDMTLEGQEEFGKTYYYNFTTASYSGEVYICVYQDDSDSAFYKSIDVYINDEEDPVTSLNFILTSSNGYTINDNYKNFFNPSSVEDNSITKEEDGYFSLKAKKQYYSEPTMYYAWKDIHGGTITIYTLKQLPSINDFTYDIRNGVVSKRYFVSSVAEDGSTITESGAAVFRIYKDGNTTVGNYETIEEKLDEIDTLTTTVSNKVDKEDGKSLSTNDFTDEEKAKLAGIEYNATRTEVDLELSTSSEHAIANKTISNKIGASNGIAKLDANGKIPIDELPSSTITIVDYLDAANTHTVEDASKYSQGNEILVISDGYYDASTAFTLTAGNKLTSMEVEQANLLISYGYIFTLTSGETTLGTVKSFAESAVTLSDDTQITLPYSTDLSATSTPSTIQVTVHTGDILININSHWIHMENTSSVNSVNAKTGAVVLSASDILDSNSKTIQADIETLTTASSISTDTDNNLTRGTDGGLYVKIPETVETETVEATTIDATSISATTSLTVPTSQPTDVADGMIWLEA